MTARIKSLPKYTKKEEIFNSLSHLIGLFFAIGVFVFFLIYHVTNSIQFIKMLPYYFYALSMAVVFYVSSMYHSSKFSSAKRAIFRLIDHCDIYVFVFGTYLPLCLYGVANKNIAIAVIIIEIVLMISGIVLNLIPSDSKIVKILSYLIYLIDGWLIIFFYPFNLGMDFLVFLFILLGGITYSIGAIVYAIGKKKRYFHTIFHIFVVLAAALQFVGIYFLLA